MGVSPDDEHPLPPNPFDATYQPEITHAYSLCLTVEDRGGWNVFEMDVITHSLVPMKDWTPKIVGRFLGYVLLYAPTPGGQQVLAREINACITNEDPPKEDLPAFASLTYLYVEGMIQLFRNPKCVIPTSINSHSPRPSLTTLAQQIEAALQEPLKSSNAKLLALARDNYRCLITQQVNLSSALAKMTQYTPSEELTTTQLAHIFGQSNNERITIDQEKREWASTAAAIVQRYAEISIINELNGQNINRAENVFTIAPNVHVLFDALNISLEPIEDHPNKYKVHTYSKDLHGNFRVPHEITFVHKNNLRFALPDARYFKLHHVCARVLHLSGAAEVLERFQRDMEQLDALAENGSSSDYLNAAIRTAALRRAAVF